MNAALQAFEKKSFLKGEAPRQLIVFNAAFALMYFFFMFFGLDRGNVILFTLLMAGEVFHLWQLLCYFHTIWVMDTENAAPLVPFAQGVDVFITVAGEPAHIVQQTVEAVLAMNYPKFSVYILNDGYVAKKENWQEMEELADRMGITCITRQTPGGAKAGNINHALPLTHNPFVVIFDADHVPHADFLEKSMPHFADEKMGFVQSPQYYKNFELNFVTRASWEQQELFFGPICRGKNNMNAVTMCGTNMIIRRTALMEVGGIGESIAEDFVTGMMIHANGWRSRYVAEVLAEGLAPEDFYSYYKQQFRWARGGLDVIFKYKLLTRPGLTFAQRLQYFASVSYWFSGIFVLIDALMPLVFLYTGAVPLAISTLALALLFIPYVFLTLYTLQRSSNFCFTFRSVAFSVAGFSIHLEAVWASLTNKKSAFAITSKQGLSGNFIGLVIPHIVYIVLFFVGIPVAVMREGVSASVITNIAWAVFNVVMFFQFIRAAVPEAPWERVTRSAPVTRRMAH